MKRIRQDFMVNGVVVPEETETQILGLFARYRPLSNFHMENVRVDRRDFRCSEAAFMAEKTFDEAQKNHLTTLGAMEAKAYGQTVTLRSDWEQVKYAAMTKVLLHKFTQSESLKALLLGTGDKYIEETNWWGDKFWGVCGEEGQNMLGKALMAVRQEIRDHEIASALFLGH